MQITKKEGWCLMIFLWALMCGFIQVSIADNSYFNEQRKINPEFEYT